MINLESFLITDDYDSASEGLISKVVDRIKGKKKEPVKEPISRKEWSELSPEEQNEFKSKILPVLKKMVAKARSSISSNKIYGARISSTYLNIDKNIDEVYDDYTNGSFYIVRGDDWDYVEQLAKSDSKYSQYKSNLNDLLDKMYADQHSELFMKQAYLYDDMRKALPSGWHMVNDGDKTEWILGFEQGEPTKRDIKDAEWYDKVLKK